MGIIRGTSARGRTGRWVRRGRILRERHAHEARNGRMSRADRDLWLCPTCGRSFANVNQTHTCAALGDLDRLFDGTAPEVRATFDRIVAIVTDLGPVSVLPEKTRIALHVRMSFAAFMPRKRWLDGHLVLARRVDSARFGRIQEYSPRNVLHAFRLTSPTDVDRGFAAWLAEAYQVGEQRHLENGGGARPRRTARGPGR
jgi:hypothetical protein